jgi:hypothetical protein
VTMMRPCLWHPLDLVEDSTQLGLERRGDSLVAFQVPAGRSDRLLESGWQDLKSPCHVPRGSEQEPALQALQ